MNSTQIFELALNLPSPWFIKETSLTKPTGNQRGQLDIYIDFAKGSKFEDEHHVLCGCYDSEERSWQHLNFFEHTCYIHTRVPRISQSTGEMRTVSVPWARIGSGFTLMFEAFAMLLIEYEMPVSKVASTLRVVAHRLWRVFSYWVQDAVAKDTLENITQIGIDETSSKKGHKYVTICVDLAKRRVIHVCEGREASVVAEIAEAIESKGGNVAAIEQVAIDMSPSYISGVTHHLPNAAIVFDRFHVTALLSKAMDELRREERKGFEVLKGHKYTLLTNYKNLSTTKQYELDYLITAFPRLGVGYQLKELLREFWQLTEKEEAMAFLAYWCDRVEETDIAPFKHFVKTIKTHWTGIINYIDAKINTGVIEGINNKIQLAKRRARGYRNTANFINMIYFIAGKLKFNYPHFPS